MGDPGANVRVLRQSEGFVRCIDIEPLLKRYDRLPKCLRDVLAEPSDVRVGSGGQPSSVRWKGQSGQLACDLADPRAADARAALLEALAQAEKVVQELQAASRKPGGGRSDFIRREFGERALTSSDLQALRDLADVARRAVRLGEQTGALLLSGTGAEARIVDWGILDLGFDEPDLLVRAGGGPVTGTEGETVAGALGVPGGGEAPSDPTDTKTPPAPALPVPQPPPILQSPERVERHVAEPAVGGAGVRPAPRLAKASRTMVKLDLLRERLDRVVGGRLPDGGGVGGAWKPRRSSTELQRIAVGIEEVLEQGGEHITEGEREVAEELGERCRRALGQASTEGPASPPRGGGSGTIRPPYGLGTGLGAGCLSWPWLLLLCALLLALVVVLLRVRGCSCSPGGDASQRSSGNLPESAPPPPPPEQRIGEGTVFSGLPLHGDCVVLVLDMSGSMESAWDALRAEVTSLAGSMGSRRLGVIGFRGGNVERVFLPPVVMDAQSTGRLHAALAAGAPAGGTNPAPAVEEALTRHGATDVILLADGDISGTVNGRTTQQLVQSRPSGTIVHAVYFQTSESPGSKSSLEALARLGGGGFREGVSSSVSSGP